MSTTTGTTIPLTGNVVTAEAAARHDGTGRSPARAVAGALAGPAAEPLRVRARNGLWMDVPPGHWVVRYGPGDAGVMSDGAYQRWFGKPASRPGPSGRPGGE